MTGFPDSPFAKLRHILQPKYCRNKSSADSRLFRLYELHNGNAGLQIFQYFPRNQ
ncbi:hypothetical protein D3C85_800970 [compost metagenome]